MEKLYLIGFMGSGKTEFGSYLAKDLQLPFYDLDEWIELTTGQSIANIFSQKGEEYFRKIESELFCSWDKTGIIACGGGVLDATQNQEHLRSQNAISIWLDTDFSLLYERIHNSERPLVKMLSKNELQLLWQKRKSIYQSLADFTIKNLEEADFAENARNIKLFLQKQFQ